MTLINSPKKKKKKRKMKMTLIVSYTLPNLLAKVFNISIEWLSIAVKGKAKISS